MSTSSESPWDVYEDDHDRDPLVIKKHNGEETLHYKKIPNPLEHFYTNQDGTTNDLDDFDLNYWIAEIEKRRAHVSSYVAEAGPTGSKYSEHDPAIDRARAVVQGQILVDTYKQLLEHFTEAAKVEVKRLKAGRQDPWERERATLWRTVVKGFQLLRDEAQQMADGMKFGAGTKPLA
ncbi:uncharacterized protein CLAFUR5_09118 [Fulvia fulva]|uniref:Uncharacterized protein n=1 Tax=Passalora fulva TaxID=5499 RepID=A0A9Q8PFD3_PASFU|nr:uncharacterized protein CLAFUR5_09118 [Fulvia fulva]UJO21450.1 hypothetical protein CLAFUR5_09118 [Fulvia fulva]